MVCEHGDVSFQKGFSDMFHKSLLPVQTTCEFVTWQSESRLFVNLRYYQNVLQFHSQSYGRRSCSRTFKCSQS